MANRKISELTELTSPANSDILHIIDVSTIDDNEKNKRITVQNLLSLVNTQIEYQTTGVAPTSTPDNGTLILDHNGGTTTLWARANNTWVSLISV